jgi:hypothetical protein
MCVYISRCDLLVDKSKSANLDSNNIWLKSVTPGHTEFGVIWSNASHLFDCYIEHSR